jgi:hypothetical protein
MSITSLLAFAGVATASTVAYAFDTVYAKVSFVTLDAVIVRGTDILSRIVPLFHEYLKHIFDILALGFWIIAAAYVGNLLPQRTVSVLGNAFTTLAETIGNVFSLYLAHCRNDELAELRKQYKDWSSPDQAMSANDMILSLSNENNELKRELLWNKDELENKQSNIATRNQRVNDLEFEIQLINDQHDVVAVRANEAKLNRELHETQHQLATLRAENSKLEKKLERSNARNYDAQWEYGARSQVERKYQLELESKQNKINLQEVEIEQLRREACEHNTTAYRLSGQVSILNVIKMSMHEMAEKDEEIDRACVSLFIAALDERGLDLTELGIDPKKFDTYYEWAYEMVNGGCSMLSPSGGLRLEGFWGPLSGVYVSNGAVFGGDKPPSIPALLPSQTLWLAPPTIGPLPSILEPSNGDSIVTPVDIGTQEPQVSQPSSQTSNADPPARRPTPDFTSFLPRDLQPVGPITSDLSSQTSTSTPTPTPAPRPDFTSFLPSSLQPVPPTTSEPPLFSFNPSANPCLFPNA